MIETNSPRATSKLAAWRHTNGEPEGTVFDLDATAALGRQMWAPHTTDRQ